MPCKKAKSDVTASIYRCWGNPAEYATSIGLIPEKQKIVPGCEFLTKTGLSLVRVKIDFS